MLLGSVGKREVTAEAWSRSPCVSGIVLVVVESEKVPVEGRAPGVLEVKTEAGLVTSCGVLGVAPAPALASAAATWEPSSNLSRIPASSSRLSGAPFASGAYSGMGGAVVILLVSTGISMFGCTMVILMLKGAIS